jgi:hypothetical protein
MREENEAAKGLKTKQRVKRALEEQQAFSKFFCGKIRFLLRY